MNRLSGLAMLSILSFLFLSSLTDNLVCASRVELVNNGYVNLVVAIADAVNPQASNKILENIKKMLESATYSLHRATNDRSFIKSVTILIPESWEQLKITNNTATWENFESADIVIDNPNPQYGHRPYTEQPGGCGDPGKRIHLTPYYVFNLDKNTNTDRFGKPGKVFVHEWAHYRYGVFDEYAISGDPDYPLFFRANSTSNPEPNICTNIPIKFRLFDITKNANTNCTIDPVTGVYDNNCGFEAINEIGPNGPIGPVSSIASYYFMDSVEKFCDNNTHNGALKNKHNKMCDNSSVWSIIEKHRDFANGANLETIDFKNITSIMFNIVKSRIKSRFVMVADVSKSMSTFSRIDKLGQAVGAWIMNDVPKGSQVGMVQFSSDADIVSNITKITDNDSRRNLINKIPKKLIGATCIGCGLRKALELLTNSSNNTGDIIVLVTDGEHTMNRIPTVNDMFNPLKAAGIRVVTIGLGKEADPDLEKLADFTGGKSYHVRDEETNSQNVRDAFLGALTYQSAVTNADLEFQLFKKVIKANDDFQFVVDPTVGRNLNLNVHGLEKSNLVSIRLTGPDGKIANTTQTRSRDEVSVTIGKAQAGNWSAKIDFQKSLAQPVTVVITSQLLPNATEVIRTTCGMPNALILNAQKSPIEIHAEVRKGNSRVIKATVQANIIKPDGKMDTITLLDNGLFADNKKDDGSYTEYYVNATQPGRYIVTCQIKNDGSAYITSGVIGSPSPLFSFDESYQVDDILPMEEFNRVTAGGSFKVEIPVPEEDPYPPADVKDLSVSLLNQSPTEVSVELKWTAPGDDLDFGIVSYYEFEYSDDKMALLDPILDVKPFTRHRRSAVLNEENLIAGSIHPNEARTQQSATFLLSDVPRGKNYYVALRAVDKSHKVSHVSNIGVIYIDGSESSDTSLFSPSSDGTHIITIMVAGLGAILMVSFSVILLGAVSKRVLTKANYAAVPLTDMKSAV